MWGKTYIIYVGLFLVLQNMYVKCGTLLDYKTLNQDASTHTHTRGRTCTLSKMEYFAYLSLELLQQQMSRELWLWHVGKLIYHLMQCLKAFKS
jgi:hypothetical protein